MKKLRLVAIACIAIVVIVIVLVVGGLTSAGSRVFSNRAWFDTTFTYEYGQIKMPDGTIEEGRITRWIDFEDGDQIEVTINGKTYLTHISNACLISE